MGIFLVPDLVHVALTVARTVTGYVVAPYGEGDFRRRLLKIHNVVIAVVEARPRPAVVVAVGTGGEALVIAMPPRQIGEIIVYGSEAVGGLPVAGPAVSVDIRASPQVAGGTRGGE